MSQKPPLRELFVEICAGSLSDALTVFRTGWKNIELNNALPLGGLTPSAGLVQTVLEKTDLNIVAMVRPRPGGFCYSQDDWAILLNDADWLLTKGVVGLAFGTLTADRCIDASKVSEVRKICGNRTLVFHRAFDLIHDWRTAIDVLVDCGVDRILTSGGSLSAIEGVSRLAEMQAYADSRIEIMAGGGVTTGNCRDILNTTGISAIHGSFSSPVIDEGYRDGPLRFADNDDLRACDEQKLLELRRVLGPNLQLG